MRAFQISFRIIFLILTISSILISQEQNGTQQELQKPQEPVTYSLLEIPAKIEEVNTYYQTLNQIVIKSQVIAQIDSLKESYLKTKEELEKDTDLDKLEEYFIRKFRFLIIFPNSIFGIFLDIKVIENSWDEGKWNL